MEERKKESSPTKFTEIVSLLKNIVKQVTWIKQNDLMDMVILIFAVIFAILQFLLFFKTFSFFKHFLIEVSMDIFCTNEQINLVEIITSKSPK